MTRTTRRQFVQGVGVAGLGLLAGCGLFSASPPEPAVRRLAFLIGGTADSDRTYIAAFQEQLREYGWAVDRQLAIEYRYAEGNVDRLPSFAAELVALPIELLVTGGIAATRAARTISSTIPIVQMIGTGDLVEAGLADSMAHPGGNVTGINSIGRQLDGKLLQLLKEAVPTVSRVAVIWDAGFFGPFAHEELTAAAQKLGVQLLPVEVNTPEAIDRGIEAATAGGADGLLTVGSSLTTARANRIVELAAQARLPAVYAGQNAIDAGGLLVYQPDFNGNGRRAAYYVDRILKGAKPADLPIELPREFTFVINLKTAQALGLTIPPHVLLQATEVIQ